jgi:hypothetical protein
MQCTNREAYGTAEYVVWCLNLFFLVQSSVDKTRMFNLCPSRSSPANVVTCYSPNTHQPVCRTANVLSESNMMYYVLYCVMMQG